MSYYQDGGNIVHLPASTHGSYSSRMNSYGSTITSNYSPQQHHGTSTSTSITTSSTSHVLQHHQYHQHHQHHQHHGHHSTNHNNGGSSSSNSSYHHHPQLHYHHQSHQPPPPSSGNSLMMSPMEASRDSLLEAGDLVLNTSASPSTAATAIDTPNRRKPDIGIVVSVISFLVWLRLFQTMFYQSVLGNLEGFIKEFLFVLLVWIPSITLTCFYFRSDDYQRRFRAAVVASGGGR